MFALSGVDGGLLVLIGLWWERGTTSLKHPGLLVWTALVGAYCHVALGALWIGFDGYPWGKLIDPRWAPWVGGLLEGTVQGLRAGFLVSLLLWIWRASPDAPTRPTSD